VDDQGLPVNRKKGVPGKKRSNAPGPGRGNDRQINQQLVARAGTMR